MDFMPEDVRQTSPTTSHEFVSGFRTLDKTVRFFTLWEGVRREFKIEAWRDSEGAFTSNLLIASIDPAGAGADGEQEIWTRVNSPWEARATADDVIRQALAHMAEAGAEAP